MFLALPLNASLVEMAIIKGFSFLKWDFAAMVTGVSVIPFASFAIVFPVAGAIIIISVIFFGPMGSAPCIVWIILFPVISSIWAIKSSALPNLVSNSYALYDIIGMTSAPSLTSSFIFGIVLENVQKEPVKAKPIFKSLNFIYLLF